MKENFRRKYLKRPKLIMKSKLNGRNKIIAINTWAVSLMRYGAGIVKWTKNELDDIDRKTRKVLTLNKEFHPRTGEIFSFRKLFPVHWSHLENSENFLLTGFVGLQLTVASLLKTDT